MTEQELLRLSGIQEFMDGEMDWYDLPYFTRDTLYDHYMDEMPYGVMKARTGDPDVWIADRLQKIKPLTQKVFVVYFNADMIEGRGPMLFHSVYADRKKAEKFIDKQPGVMGRKVKWSTEKYGDWTIEEKEMIL